MSDLRVINQDGKLLVDSREVARMVEKRHDHLIRDIKGYAEVLEDSPNLGSHNFFIESTYTNSQNKEQPCYLLTKKGCDMVANKMTGEKGIIFTAIYVTKFEEFEKMEKELKEGNNLKLDSKFMYQIAQQLEEKEKQIALMAPKVLFADAVSTSKSTVLVGELAKILKQNGIEDMGQNRLFTWLRKNGFLIKRNGADYNMPTQKSMELELMEVKITTTNNPDGSIRVNKTPKVTGKGQIYFVNKFKEKESA